MAVLGFVLKVFVKWLLFFPVFKEAALWRNVKEDMHAHMHESAWKKAWHFLFFWDKLLVGPVAYKIDRKIGKKLCFYELYKGIHRNRNKCMNNSGKRKIFSFYFDFI